MNALWAKNHMLFTHRCPSYSRALEYSPPQFQWSVLSSQTREVRPRAALAPWTLMWVTKQQRCSEARFCVSHRSRRALGGNAEKTFWGFKCRDTPHKLCSFHIIVTQTTARMFQPLLPGLSGFLHMLFPLSRRLVPSYSLGCFLYSFRFGDTSPPLGSLLWRAQPQSSWGSLPRS